MATERKIGFIIEIKGTNEQQRELNKLTGELIKTTANTAKFRKAAKDAKGNNLLFNASLTKSILRQKNLSKRIGETTRAIQQQSGQFKKTGGLFTSVNKAVSNSFRQVGVAIGLAFGARAIAGVIGGAIKIFKDFEQAQANLAAVLGKTRKEITQLTEDAKRLGGTTVFTATQVSGLQKEFAKLGFSTQEILNATEATLDLAAATGTDLAQAATVAGATVRGFGLDASETQRVVDVMARSFSLSALDLDKFQVAMANVAPVAKAAGLSIEETTGFLGILTDRGIDASKAGTDLRNIFLELSKQGLTLDQALDKIRNSTNKNSTALKLFGKRGSTSALIMAENSKQAEVLTEKLNNAGGAAEEMAEVQLNTLTGDLTLLSSAWEGFIISLIKGEGFISNVLRGTVSALTGLIQTLGASFQTLEEIRSKVAEDALAENVQQDTKEFESFLKTLKVNTKNTLELVAARDAFLRQNRERLDLIKDLSSADEGEIESLIERIDTINKFVVAAAKENDAIKKTTEISTEELEKREKAAAAARNKNKAISEKFAEERRLALLTEEQREIDTITKRATRLETAGVNEVEIEKFVTEESKKIRDKFRKKESEENFKAIQDNIKAQQNELAFSLLILEEQFAKGEISEKKFKNERLRIRKETLNGIKQILESELNALTVSLEKANIEESLLSDEQEKELLFKIQELKTKLAELEKPVEGEKLTPLKKLLGLDEEDIQITFEALSFIGESLSAIGNLQNTITNERIKTNNEEKNSVIKNIDAQIAAANKQGKDTENLEKQKQAIIDANEAKNKKIAQEGFARNKKLQAATAIISGAQAILSVLAAPPATDIISDTIIRAIKIASTAAATALQVATIAKTTLAEGGLIPGTYDGKDNIPALLSRGEVVLNPMQQSRLGGAEAFRAAGVPGFQAGGAIGAPPNILPPSVAIANVGSTGAISREEALELVAEAVNEQRVIMVESDVTTVQKRVEVIEAD